MGTKKISQTEMILEHMKRYGGITTKEASDYYGCTRLSARVYEIKAMGYRVDDDEWVTVKDRYGRKCRVKRYSLNE